MKNKIQYILVNGFYASGSSAVIDYLKEFEHVYVPDCELRFIKEPHGIIDLDCCLNGFNDVLNEDIEIREFIWFMKKQIKNGRGFRSFGRNFGAYFGKDITALTNAYIRNITDCRYKGYWDYLPVYDSYARYIVHKICRRIGIEDRVNFEMYFRSSGEEQFRKATRIYLNKIFEKLLAGRTEHTIVLDQAVPANQPAWGHRYFPGCKIITVDRDPRGVFNSSIKQVSQVLSGSIGKYALETGRINLFTDYYKKMRRKSLHDAPHLEIQFEDFVLDRNGCRKKLLEYVGFEESSHIHKGKYFVPENSRKNIDIWKNLPYKKEIAVIEKELPEYLAEMP